MYGTRFIWVFGMFVIGLLIGGLIVVCQLLRGVGRKKRYGFSEPAPLNLKEMNPSEGSSSHAEKPEAVDGAAATNDFKHR